MAGKVMKIVCLLGLLGVVMLQPVAASDPDLTTDFGIMNISVNDLKFEGFENPMIQQQGMLTPVNANFMNFKGLTGLGMAAVLFEFGPMSQIDPHTHPRATELFYLVSGTVDVGLVDTNNTLFETTLKQGDLFVFPKGLLHFQRNNQGSQAIAYSVLNSENPGTLMIAKALFNSTGCGMTGLPDNVLETAFKTDEGTVENIKRAFNA